MKISLSIIAAIALAVFTAGVAYSAGPGLVFGTAQAEKMSREASNDALKGFEAVMKSALASPDNVHDSVQLLFDAANSFYSASSRMQQLTESDFPDFDLGTADHAVIRARMGDNRYQLNDHIRNAKTFKDLCLEYAALAQRLAEMLPPGTGHGTTELTYIGNAPWVRDFMAVGEAVTLLSKTRH